MRVLSIVRFVLVAAMAGIALPGAIPEAAGADLTVARAISRETAGKRGPIARRGLSKLSTAVLASDGCWRSCTVACGRDLQHCRGTLPFNLCLVGNNRCERLCLQDCRLKGGPLVYPD